jgi:pimeloyl-ACP methyl ester carboxylesterase
VDWIAIADLLYEQVASAHVTQALTNMYVVRLRGFRNRGMAFRTRATTSFDARLSNGRAVRIASTPAISRTHTARSSLPGILANASILAFDRERSSARSDRRPSVRARQSAGDGGSVGLVSRPRRAPVGPTKVPTLYLSGDHDDTVGRAAAEGTGEFIAARYEFEVLRGVGHYAPIRCRSGSTNFLLTHLARHAV